jgi:hypothetical protein
MVASFLRSRLPGDNGAITAFAAIWRTGVMIALRDNIDTARLIIIFAPEAVSDSGGVKQSCTAAWNDAF